MKKKPLPHCAGCTKMTWDALEGRTHSAGTIEHPHFQGTVKQKEPSHDWKKEFSEKYGSFEFSKFVSKKDHDALLAFIEKAMEAEYEGGLQLRREYNDPELLKEIGYKEYQLGWIGAVEQMKEMIEKIEIPHGTDPIGEAFYEVGFLVKDGIRKALNILKEQCPIKPQ